MSTECSHHHCQYAYQASAYGLAGEIERPVSQSITAQAACSISQGGGRSSHRVGRFCTSPFVCFDAAYCEVGGSYDECHDIHTTYVHSVVEGLNIAEILTADRVVSRMVIYSPTHDDPSGEHTYDLTGSRFENLRIAGHLVEVGLTIQKLNPEGTYQEFENAFQGEQGSQLLPWGGHGAEELQGLEDKYHALMGLGKRAENWAKPENRRRGGAYWSSVVDHSELKEAVQDTGLQAVGGMILVPKFGVIRLAQLLVHPDYRRLTMFQVQMCSGSTGASDGGSTTGGGLRPFP